MVTGYLVAFKHETQREGSSSSRGNRESCSSCLMRMVVTIGWVSKPVLYPENNKGISFSLEAWPCGCQHGFLVVFTSLCTHKYTFILGCVLRVSDAL